MSSADFYGGHRDDEPSATAPHHGHLLHDLLPQVPGKDEHVLRLGRHDQFRCMNRYATAGQKLSLLVRTLVDRELEEIPANPAVVQKRVALRRRAVADDRRTLAPQRDQTLEQPSLQLANTLT